MQAVTLRLDEERTARALAEEEAVRTRRELEVAVSAVAESEAELKNLKVLRPSPCSTRLGQTRHGSNMPHIFNLPHIFLSLPSALPFTLPGLLGSSSAPLGALAS